jgi:hypothetical protein
MIRYAALVLVLSAALCAGAQTAAAPPAGGPAAKQPTVAGAAPLVAISAVNQSMVKTRVTVQGEVVSHEPPRNDRAPHSLLLRDATGTMRIAIWKDLWDKLPQRDKIVPGQKLTVKAEIAPFRGNLEGHPYLPGDVTLGVSQPQPAALGPGAVAPPAPDAAPKPAGVGGIQWQPDLAAAMREAQRTGRTILVFFEKPGAESSRKADADVFGDARVCTAVNEKCVALRVNLVAQQDLAQRLGAIRAGSAILYKPDGTAIKRLDNLEAPDDLIGQIP